MNRKIQTFCLGAILIALFSFKVQAQQPSTMWINAIVGGNNTWVLNQNAYGNQEIEYAPTLGLTGGVGVSIFYNRKWGFNGSALVSKLGQNYSGYQGGVQSKRKVKLTYLEVPLLAMRNIPDMRYPTWVSFGPDVMVLLNAKQDYTREGESTSTLPNPDGMLANNTKDRFKAIDVGINLSLNRMYTVGYYQKFMFLISINSTIGLADINQSSWQIPNTHSDYGRSHNFYIGVKTGIMYKAKRIGRRGHW